MGHRFFDVFIFNHYYIYTIYTLYLLYDDGLFAIDNDDSL
jgi:hypothetical protein